MADAGIAISDSGTHGAFSGQHAHPHTGGDGKQHNEQHKHQDDGDHGHDCSAAMPFAGTEARMAPEQAQRFAEELRQLREENAALRQASEQSKTAAEAARQLAEQLAADAQTKRFSEEIAGWWLGATTKPGEDVSQARQAHLTTLRTLASTFGEDSEPFRGYVQSQRAVAEAVKHSDVFRVAGMSGAGDPASAEAKVLAMARQYTEQNPNLSLVAAQERVFAEQPDLYARYESERTARASGR